MSKKEKTFIFRVLLLVIIIKLILATAYFYFWLLPGRQDVIGPDGEWYSQRGWYISRVLAGKADYTAPTAELTYKTYYRVVDFYKRRLPPFNSRANGLFTYFIGIVYFFLGYVPLLIKGMNIIISAASSIMIYLLARRLYEENTAKVAFILFTFFPSTFIFSVSSLRDPLLILCIIMVLYALVKLAKELSLNAMALLGVSYIPVLFLSPELFLICGMTILVSFLASGTVKAVYKFLLTLTMAVIMLLVTNTGLFRTVSFEPGTLIKDLPAVIFSKNAGLYATGGNLAHKVFPDKYYETYKNYKNEQEYFKSKEKITWPEFLRLLPRGIVYYLVKPFPFVRHGAIYSLMSIQMLWWYLILILALLGVFRTDLLSAYPVLTYLAVMFFIMAMVDANEGILFRHRDMIVPFIVLFASAGVNMFLMKGKDTRAGT